MRLLSKRFGRSSQPNYHPTSEQQEHLSSVQNKIRNDFYELQKYPCPTCDCHDPEIIGEVDRHGLPCSTTICTGCGLLMTNPCFRPEDYGDFYAHHYRGIYKDIRIGVSGEEIPEDYEAIIQNKQRVVEQYKFLQKHCEINSTLKVLELGCGKGELLYQLDKDGCECIGTDYDEKAIAFGQAHGLKLVKGDLSNVNENDFDLVIMSHSLEHIPNPAEIINGSMLELSLRMILLQHGTTQALHMLAATTANLLEKGPMIEAYVDNNNDIDESDWLKNGSLVKPTIH